MFKILSSLLLLIISSLSFPSYAANYKVEALSCNGCSAYTMKMQAQSGWFTANYDYVVAHVFDETNLTYRKYKVYKSTSGGHHGEPGIVRLNAVEQSIDLDVESSFLALVAAKQNALTFLDGMVYEIKSLGAVKAAIKTPYNGSGPDQCQAKPVLPDEKLPTIS